MPDPVTVTFSKLPEGVTVAAGADQKILGEEGTYVLQADETAALVTDHHADVTAHGPQGTQVTEMLVISVKEKS